MRHALHIIGLAFLVFITSCKDEKVNVVEIPSWVEDYVESFVLEGQKRGVEVVIDDLIIQFEKNLKVDGNPAAGLCRTQGNKTPVILLDTTSSNWRFSKSSREQLVFHELGHCYLDRPHIEQRMPNSNFNSIMRPSGEQLYGPNMNAFKREYYLDELFREQTPRPTWSEKTEYSAHGNLIRTVIFQDDFSNNQNGWPLGKNSISERYIRNGVFEVISVNDSSVAILRDFPQTDAGDFELEIDITFVNDKSFAFLLWEGTNFNIRNHNFINLTPKSAAVIGNFEYGIESSLEGFLKNNGSTITLTVRRVGEFYYIFLEQIQIEVLQFKGSNGIQGALGIGGGAHVKFDNLKLYSLK